MDQVSGAQGPTWKVPAACAGARLDAFVRHRLPHLSRRLINSALAAKFFLIDGRAGKKGERLCAGQQVTFAGPPAWLLERPTPEFQLDPAVVYEDASILVLDKPAGVATHGFSALDIGTLANWLAAHRPELRDVGRSRWEPGLLHRLDIETSGLILIAKTQAAFERLRAQLRRREIKKTYWALVWNVTDAAGVIDWPLAHDPSDKRKMALAQAAAGARRARSWRARTHYRKIASAEGVSLLEVSLSTGVTHQIRVHLASRGFPIVGDRLYGAADRSSFGLSRHFLHAMRLEFRHPDDDRAMDLTAPLAAELREVLERLRLTG